MKNHIFKKKINTFVGLIIILLFVGAVFGIIFAWQERSTTKEILVIEKYPEKEEREKEVLSVEPHSETSSPPEKLSGQMTRCLYTIEGVSSPKGVAFSPSGKELWVTSLMNQRRGIVVFDTQTGEHVKDIVLPGGGGVEVIFNREGSFAYVSQMETGRVFEIDVSKKIIVRTFDMQSSWTKVMTLSPEENYLYASNWTRNDISVVNLETGVTEKTLPSVGTPRGVYFSPDSDALYVAGFGNGQLQKIDPERGDNEILFTSGGALRHIVGDKENKVIYFSDMAKGAVYKMNLETKKVEKLSKTENNPNTITLTPDKKILAVSNRGVNHPSGNYYIPGPEWGTVLLFNTESGELVDVLLGGNQPTGLDINRSGKYLAYSNFLDGEVVLCKLPKTEDLLKREKGELVNYEKKIKK